MADPKLLETAVRQRKAERNALWRGAHQATWLSPFAKLRLYWQAIAASALLFLYGLLSGHGRSVLRPLIGLAAANYGAFLLYKSAAKPATTVVGRAASGTWGWIKSQFVSSPTTTVTRFTDEQEKALFDFWWSSAVPIGTIPNAAYEKSIALLFGAGGAPWSIHVLQGGHALVNAFFLFLIALALRSHFRVGGPSGG